MKLKTYRVWFEQINAQMITVKAETLKGAANAAFAKYRNECRLVIRRAEVEETT
jgi:hypothetical protein